MRCKACDKFLEDFELTRKDRETGVYLDLCNKCFTISEADLLDTDVIYIDDLITTNYTTAYDEEVDF